VLKVRSRDSGNELQLYFNIDIPKKKLKQETFEKYFEKRMKELKNSIEKR
jgi:hypothetical protein